MPSLRWKAILIGALLAGGLVTACRSTFVVVPPSDPGYTAADTLRGWLRGDEVRVTFRVDTITRVRTITRVDTLFRDTLVRVETRLIPDSRPRTDTVIRVDTVRVPGGRIPIDTIRVPVADTVFRTDTLRLTVTDTVVRADTIRVPGKRLLFLPPGHFPPEGQCRVWVHGLPPGQQAASARCDAIRSVPARAFVLFGGDAWDFDYDWIAEALQDPDSVPPEIVALKRRGGG